LEKYSNNKFSKNHSGGSRDVRFGPTDGQTKRSLLVFFQHFANATKNETWHTQIDKKNDGKDKILKEVKRKIINGRMKGRGTNKGIKKAHMWCAERASGFLLISCARQQSPRGGKRFPVVIVNQRTADGPQSRQTGLVDVNTHICCCRTLYFCSKLSGIFPLETSAVCQNLWTCMGRSSNVFIIFMLPNPELRTFLSHVPYTCRLPHGSWFYHPNHI